MTEAVMDTIRLDDIPIPDLSGVIDDTKAPSLEDGWYAGTILEKRAFTDSNGNDRVFESGDTTSANGESRNIKLQVELTRQSDQRTVNMNALINYRGEDLTQETVQAVLAQQERVKSKDEKNMGAYFRPFMTLQRLGTLQRIAGVRQLQRNGNGGLDLTPLFGKKAYFRIGPDTREGKSQYKQIETFSDAAPKGKKAVLL